MPGCLSGNLCGKSHIGTLDRSGFHTTSPKMHSTHPNRTVFHLCLWVDVCACIFMCLLSPRKCAPAFGGNTERESGGMNSQYSSTCRGQGEASASTCAYVFASITRVTLARCFGLRRRDVLYVWIDHVVWIYHTVKGFWVHPFLLSGRLSLGVLAMYATYDVQI